MTFSNASTGCLSTEVLLTAQTGDCKAPSAVQFFWHAARRRLGPASIALAVESTHLLAGVLCGAAASGQFEWTPESVAKSALCMLMSGPLLTGYTQTINDFYDKDIDAINEPNRPIPSGDASYAILS